MAVAAVLGLVFRTLTLAPLSRSISVMIRPMPELPPVTYESIVHLKVGFHSPVTIACNPSKSTCPVPFPFNAIRARAMVFSVFVST